MITKLVQYLENQYQNNPMKCMIEQEQESLSVGQVYWSAVNLAYEIQRVNKNKINCPIVVYMEKGIDEYLTLMGVLCSGNYYVPVDTNMPEERANTIFQMVNPKLVITKTSYKEKLTRSGYTGHVIEMIRDTEKKLDRNIVQWISKIIDTDPAYMLFTSGSTGIPKGVVVSQRAVIDYIEWQCATLPFDEFSVLGSQAPFYFDASMPDIYTPLRCGGKLVIIPEVLFLFPNKLIEYILKKKVNTLIWVPSALMTLTNKNFFDSNQIPKLKLVMFCGEVMPCKHLNKWIQYCPDAMYVNLYGPTETAYACTYYIVQRKFEDDEKLPIGYPCGNTDIIVMDDYNCKIDTKNTIGELCVRGSSLALGYYKDTVKTENCFVSNPLNSSYSEKIYKTGDLVQYNKWGELEFIGRKDYQIKKMGYRIELGEIETVTYSISAVKQCSAIYNENSKKIVLFCTLSEQIDKKDMFRILKQKLPKYMLPNEIHILSEMPKNRNGKIDRIKLKTYNAME